VVSETLFSCPAVYGRAAYNNDEDVDAVLEALDAEQALVCRTSSHAVR
jgi:hypothetical protein